MTPNDVKDYIAAISDALKPLADKIGMAGNVLFGYAVRHSYAVAVGEVVGFFFAALPIVWLVKFYKWCEKNDKWDQYFPAVIACGLIGMADVICVIVSAVYLFTDAVPRLIAPEWSAIYDIMQAVHR